MRKAVEGYVANVHQPDPEYTDTYLALPPVARTFGAKHITDPR
jgi:hypothetical protein